MFIPKFKRDKRMHVLLDNIVLEGVGKQYSKQKKEKVEGERTLSN